MKVSNRSDLKVTLITCFIFVIPVSMFLFGSIILSVDALREPLQKFILCKCSDKNDIAFKYSDGGTVRKLNGMNKEKGTEIVKIECLDCA